MGWKEALKAKGESRPRWVRTLDEPGVDLAASWHLAWLAKGWDPLSRVTAERKYSSGPIALLVRVETFDAAGEGFRYAWGTGDCAMHPGRVREALSRLYLNPKWQDFDPNDSPGDAEQAVRVAETKAWAAREAWKKTNERRAEMAKKQKAESELTEITIHGIGFVKREELADGVASALATEDDEDDYLAVLSVCHSDPDLDAMLAPGGKYSVTIRREEG